MNTPLPPDVAAYLKQAAVELATEQGLTPDSEESLRVWMSENCKEIGTRAQSAMRALMEKLMTRQDMMDLACEVVSERVYNSIPKTNTKPWNARFVRYAQSRNMTPEEVLKADGNMTNFMCWKEVA